MKTSPIIRVDFSIGFGNNLFQFTYAKLLAEKIGAKIYILPPSGDYFGIDSLDLLVSDEVLSLDTPITVITNFQKAEEIFSNNLSTDTIITEKDAKNILHNPENKNYILRGYFEDYTLYENDLEKIRGWFIKPPDKNKDDVILHLRLGDRLFIKGTYDPEALLTFERYQNGLSQINFNKLHIVSDLPSKIINSRGSVTAQDLLETEYHTHLENDSIEMAEKAAKYVNELIGKFSNNYKTNFWNQGLDRDFQRIMWHDKIIFGYSTFAWWAATLSGSSQVGVFKPWRPMKKTGNKNLGQTNYPGWFGWS